MQQSIQRIYTKNVIKINENESLFQANDLMNNYNIRHLPVVDNEEYLVGLLSKTDFYGLRLHDSRFTGFTVKDVMSNPVKMVTPNTKVSHVVEIMLAHKISCVLIANHEELLGILTTEDLLKLLIDLQTAQRDLQILDLAALAEEGWISATH